MNKDKQPRVFGQKTDTKFWSDKPIQKGHPDYEKEISRLKKELEDKSNKLKEAYNQINRMYETRKPNI